MTSVAKQPWFEAFAGEKANAAQHEQVPAPAVNSR
jgi:hypothetical protein